MEGTSMNSSAPSTPDQSQGGQPDASNSQDSGRDQGSENERSEGSEGSEHASGEGKSKAPAKSQKQALRELAEQDMDAMVTLKVNGQQKKMPVREALKYAQLGDSAYQKMQEASSLKKQALEFQRFAKENPKAFLQKLGMDPYAFAEATLTEKLELLGLTDEQKRLRAYEQKEAEYKKQAEQEQLTKKQQEEQRREHAAAQSLDKDITEAFKNSGLPKHPFYVQQIAATMLAASKMGEQLSPAEAADKIKARTRTHIRELVQNLDAQAIQELLGDQVLKKIREAEVKRVTDGTAPTATSTTRPGSSPATTNPKTPKKPMNEKEYRKWVENL